MEECAAAALDSAQSDLDQVLAEVGAFVSDERAGVLRDSEPDWVAYRDDLCDAHSLDSGSIQGFNGLACKVNLTRHHIHDLCRWALPNAEFAAVEPALATCEQLTG